VDSVAARVDPEAKLFRMVHPAVLEIQIEIPTAIPMLSHPNVDVGEMSGPRHLQVHHLIPLMRMNRP